MWKLVIEDDEGKRTVVPLTRDHYSVGRKEGNTIRLTERNVSRDHARIHKKNGAGLGEKPTFVLEDLTSYNGVFVNGLRVAQAQDLAHGDLVQIGDYRIVLQDEILADAQEVDTGEAKQTIPSAPNARAAALMDRPNRLVMLTGPAPGSEFPLDRDRLSIGRAEDATISVNHNSVSRAHCEVHALGDGRFEIVDKGSSNGVRVNGAELRRGIIESGDLIELGDVKFKFIGAGQIFRATESQQLAAMSDRVARDIAGPPRSSNALPLAAFVVVVVAGAVGAWVYTRPPVDAAPTPAVAAVSPDRSTLDRAKKLCAAGDCETAHTIIAVHPRWLAPPIDAGLQRRRVEVGRRSARPGGPRDGHRHEEGPLPAGCAGHHGRADAAQGRRGPPPGARRRRRRGDERGRPTRRVERPRGGRQPSASVRDPRRFAPRRPSRDPPPLRRRSSPRPPPPPPPPVAPSPPSGEARPRLRSTSTSGSSPSRGPRTRNCSSSSSSSSASRAARRRTRRSASSSAPAKTSATPASSRRAPFNRSAATSASTQRAPALVAEVTARARYSIGSGSTPCLLALSHPSSTPVGPSFVLMILNSTRRFFSQAAGVCPGSSGQNSP